MDDDLTLIRLDSQGSEQPIIIIIIVGTGLQHHESIVNTSKQDVL